jgi:hypothetical protein
MGHKVAAVLSFRIQSRPHELLATQLRFDGFKVGLSHFDSEPARPDIVAHERKWSVPAFRHEHPKVI